MHAVEAQVGEVGWDLLPVNHRLRSDGIVMADVDRGGLGMDGTVIHLDRNHVGSRMEDLIPTTGVEVG